MNKTFYVKGFRKFLDLPTANEKNKQQPNEGKMLETIKDSRNATIKVSKTADGCSRKK